MDIISAVKALPVQYHESIFRILSQYTKGVGYTKNRNGTFIDLESLDASVLDLLRDHIRSIKELIRARSMNTTQQQPQQPPPKSNHDIANGVTHTESGPTQLVFSELPKAKKNIHFSKRHQAILAAIRRIERNSKSSTPFHVASLAGGSEAVADEGDAETKGDFTFDGDDEPTGVLDDDPILDDASLDDHDGDSGDEFDIASKASDDHADDHSDLAVEDIDSSDEGPMNDLMTNSSTKYVSAPRLCAFLQHTHTHPHHPAKFAIVELTDVLTKLKFPIPEILL